MSTKQQAQNKTKKPERQPQVEARQPAQAELAAALADLDGGQLQRLPDHATTRPLRQTAVLQMQRRHGNTHVQQMLGQVQAPSRNGHKTRGHKGNQETGADSAEAAHDPLSDNAGAGPPTGLPITPPPPGSNGNGTGAANGRTGLPALVQRQEEEEDSGPSEAEKAAALAAAKAAEQQASQTANEGQQQVAQSKTKKAAEQEAAKTAKQKASQAKSETPQKKGAAGQKEKGAGKKKTRPGKAATDGTGPGAAAAPVAGAQAGAARDGKAPSSPEEDPGFQAAVRNIKGVSAKEKTHAPATAKAGEAQDAAESPAAETEAKAQANQVGEMEQAPTPGFNAAAFKAKLMQRIQALAPKTAEEADNFKESDKLGGVKGEMQGQVAAEKEASQAPMQEATQKAPDTGSVEPKPVTPLDPAAPGAPPPKVGASQAVPKSKGCGEVEAPMRAESKKPDQVMAENDVTEAQLAKSNEPEFQAALDSKKEARAHAREAPQNYRQFEQTQLAQAEAEATTTAETRTQAMHGDRAQLLQQVASQQGQTKTEDEQARRKVASDIQKIYDRTQTKVETILDDLDTSVEKVFDEGAATAKQAFENYVDAKMEAYKERRYGGWLGWARWIDDKVSGMPSEVNAFYQQGRQLYLRKMDAVIDNVVSIIGRGLTEAKAEIANGKKEIQQYVNKLPQDLQEVGQQAAQNIQNKFDALEEQVNNKQDELIDSLANKYQENLQAVDARIEEMKEANKGLVAKAIDKIGGAIKTILELKDMLMGVLSRAAAAVKKIIKDPIGFLGNLISGVKQGFQNFVGNIGKHLKKGLIGWLTGTIAEAGITLPESFDLKGIFQLVMQILGLTFDRIRARIAKLLGFDPFAIFDQIKGIIAIYQEEGLAGLAKHGLARVLGEERLAALMQVTEIFEIIQSGQLGQLWEIVQEHLSNLKEMVFGKIQEFIAEKVIKAGVTWVISLFNPAGAFIRACKMIYDIVMFFVERGKQIMSLVNAVVDSVASIASGNISGAAQFIEDSLAKSIPVAISFLSSLLGLGGVSQKVKEIIESVRGMVDRALDAVFNSRPVQMVAGFIKKVVGRVKSLAKAGVAKVKGLAKKGAAKAKGALGLGKEKAPAAAEAPEATPATEGEKEGPVGEKQPVDTETEDHQLWAEVHGGKATVIMASTPTSLNQLLARWEAQAGEGEGQQLSLPGFDVRQLVATAREQQKAVRTAAEAAAIEETPKTKANLETAQTQLVATVERILSVTGTDHDAEQIVAAVDSLGIVDFMKAMARGQTVAGLDQRKFQALWDSGEQVMGTGTRKRTVSSWIKDRFRAADPGKHEWIPSNFIPYVIDRSANFADGVEAAKWIDLQHKLRVNTSWIIFNPEKMKSLQKVDRKEIEVPYRGDYYTLLHGHSGAVNFGYPVGDRGKGQLTVAQSTFHNKLREAFIFGATVEECVANLKTIFQEWVWDGKTEPDPPILPFLWNAGDPIYEQGRDLMGTQQERYQEMLTQFDTILNQI